ncbi:bestrophin family protein [Chitinophaga lutea]
MLLSDKLTLVQVFRMTWKLDLAIILVCSLAYCVDTYWMKAHISIPVTITTVLGTALAFFIGFNNNQAYDRWWEGRKLWGAQVNDSRSWARNLQHYCDMSAAGETPHLVNTMIFRQIAFNYALKTALRKSDDTYYEGYLSKKDMERLDESQNIPNAILAIQAGDLRALRDQGAVDGFAFLELNSLLVKQCDNMGGMERIRNTTFPPSYLFFTRVFIWFFVIVSTFMLSESIGFWAVIFGWAIGFVFHITHQNGIHLMNPFETNPMSLPLDSITRTIEINLLDMIGHRPLPSPVAPVNNQYLL